MTAPIIVSALFGPADFARFDGLRRAHFPVERNRLRAHLTLFHHLPPSVCGELVALLKDLTKGPRPAARCAGLMNLGRGVAYRIESEGLERVRAQIAERFAGMLMPQDQAGWRPHVTVQNKVAPSEARALLGELSAGFVAGPVVIAGLAAWWYRGGPWELIRAQAFAGEKLPPDFADPL